MKKVRTRNTKFRKTKSRLRTQKRYGKRSKLVKRTKSKRYNKRQKGGSGLGETETVVEVSGNTSQYPTLDRLIRDGNFASLLGMMSDKSKAKQLEAEVFELDEQAKILRTVQTQYRNLVEVVDKVKTEIENLASSTEKDLIRQQLDTTSEAEGNPLYTMKYIQEYLKITEQGGKEKLEFSINDMDLNYPEILEEMRPIEAAIHIVQDLNSQVLALKGDLAIKEQQHKAKVSQIMGEMQQTHEKRLHEEIQKTTEVERGRAQCEDKIRGLIERIQAYEDASESPDFSEGSPPTGAGAGAGEGASAGVGAGASANAGGGETQLEDNNVNITSHGTLDSWNENYPNSRIIINVNGGGRGNDIIITRVATLEQMGKKDRKPEKTIPIDFANLKEVKININDSILELTLNKAIKKHKKFTIRFESGGDLRVGSSQTHRETLIAGVQIEGSPIEKAVEIFQEAHKRNLLTGTGGSLTIVK